MAEKHPTDPLIAPTGSLPPVAQEIVHFIGEVSSGPLKGYFDQPELNWVKGPDGQYGSVETGRTIGEEVASGIELAAREVEQGRIGVASLVRGTINAKKEVGQGDTSRNLRTVFENINQLFGPHCIDASVNFHVLFAGFDPSHADMTRAGNTLGGIATGSATEAQLMLASHMLQERSRPVQYNNEHGEPAGKFFALVDPDTKSAVPNVMVEIGSGIFKDPEGSESRFSNIAWANLIMLPEGIIEPDTEHPPVESGEAKGPVEAIRVPDAKAIDILTHGMPAQYKIGGEGQGGEFSDTVKRAPLAVEKNDDGTEAALTHLVFMGSSVLGVVRTSNSGTEALQETRVVLLPIGAQSTAYESGKPRPQTLLRLNIEEAKEPRLSHGAVQDWELINLGRAEIKVQYGVEDTAMSRRHGRIDLTGQEAGLKVYDTGSTNGTQFMTMDTFSHGAHTALSRQSALALLVTLQDNPELWLEAKK